MSVIWNEVRRGLYLDSVALMRMSREIAAAPGVEEAGLMMGTPANKEALRGAGLLAPAGEDADAGDLVLAVRAADAAAAESAAAAARRAVDQPQRAAAETTDWRPRSLRAAVALHADLNFALISTPGGFAAGEARKALRAGLNVMIFSDNVPIEEEIDLKREARAANLLVMGPDCGTAIIGGTPLAFANRIPRGRIGVIGASGAGIQEACCLIARMGHGVSHAIGVGGRDLRAEVGGASTLQAIDLFDEDADTDHVVLISKPPAAAVVDAIARRIAESAKTFTICFIGGPHVPFPPNARLATTLKRAAELATGGALGDATPLAVNRARAPYVRGLFSGGTLCAEAQVLFRDHDQSVASNVAIPGVRRLAPGDVGHILIDLGEDQFTRGRPHPMIEPATRDAPLAEALADPTVGVILLDVVLGFGSHSDPAGHLAARLDGRPADGPLIVASVTGVEGDPQVLSVQTRTLAAQGVLVAPSNADAAILALKAATG